MFESHSSAKAMTVLKMRFIYVLTKLATDLSRSVWSFCERQRRTKRYFKLAGLEEFEEWNGGQSEPV